MKRSQFDLLLRGGTHFVLFNTFTGRGAPLDLAGVAHVSRTPPERLDAASVRQLREVGSLLDDEVDESARLQQCLRERAAAERVADVTYVLGARGDESESPGWRQALDLVAELWREGQVDLVKLRLCPAACSPVAARVALLNAARARLHPAGVRLVTMWMGRRLAEATAVRGDEADAFFFRWVLTRQTTAERHWRRALSAVAELVAAGHPVALQLALGEPANVEGWREALGWAARQPALRSEGCQWDVAPARRDALFFLPAACHERDEPTRARLADAREALARLGLGVRAAVSPGHLHVACLGQRPRAWLFDRHGARDWCDQPVSAAPLAADECLACAHAPFCLGGCPGRPDYGRHSPGCPGKQEAIRRELQRLAATGQLTLVSRAAGAAPEDDR